MLSGEWSHFTGPNLLAFEREFAELQGARFGVACNGGTTALEIALRAVGAGVGGEVIVPTYTFVADACGGAASRPGGRVFCDVEEDTFKHRRSFGGSVRNQPHPGDTASALPGGRAVDMDGVYGLAAKHDLKIVEDACHGWGASWRDRGPGSLGDAAGFSFQASKNLTSGEGGFVTANDDEIADIASRIRHGGDGEKAGRPVVFPGNFRMSEIQAALLRSQMRRLPEQNRTRMENAEYLTDRLSEIDGIRVSEARSRRHEVFDSRIPRPGSSPTNLTEFREIPSWRPSTRREYPFGLVTRRRCRSMSFSQADSNPFKAGNGYSNWAPDGGVDYSAMETPVASRLCLKEAIALSQPVFLGPRSDMDSIVEAIAKVRANVGELIGAGTTI